MMPMSLCNGFDYVIRLRSNITVTDAKGKSQSSADWIDARGRATALRHARVTANRYDAGIVVRVHAKGMKAPWCPAASNPQAHSRTLIKHYAERWSIEPSSRDTKDLRFGRGMRSARISNPERRDPLFLLNAFARVLLTLLGVAGESLGSNKHSRANTVKRRTQAWLPRACRAALRPHAQHARGAPTSPRGTIQPDAA